MIEGNHELNFDKPEDEGYILQLESENAKLKAEKELGWTDQDNQGKNEAQVDLLNKEINRLNQKLKTAMKDIEDFKTKEADWTAKEAKYKAICNTFKGTIADLKKKIESNATNKEREKDFEKLFGEAKQVRKEYEEEVKVLYSLINDLNTENIILREDRGARRNKMVDYLESSIKLFEERA